MSTSSHANDNHVPSERPELTVAAARRLRELINEQDNPALKLRVCVDGGGCSGFQYSFAMDTQQAADDVVVTRDGVCLVVDAVSLPYLAGASVDYDESFIGAQFVVRNPNVHATCGCGSSFSV